MNKATEIFNNCKSETKEANKASIPTGRYFRCVDYASRMTRSFVEYHPTGEEVWSEKPYSVNSFGMGIKRWYVYAHERAKRAFSIFVAETPEQVRFLGK